MYPVGKTARYDCLLNIKTAGRIKVVVISAIYKHSVNSCRTIKLHSKANQTVTWWRLAVLTWCEGGNC